MRKTITLAAAVAAVASAPAAAAPTPATTCDRLLPDHLPVTWEAHIGGGLTAFVADRYGGYLPRFRHGAVQFTLRVRRGSHVLDRRERAAALASVDDQLDGHATRNPFYLNSKVADGRHTFTFTVTRRGGRPTTLDVPFTVGECDTSAAFATLRGRRSAFAASVESGRNERGGNAPLTAVTFSGGSGVHPQLPAVARGQVVGRIRSLGSFGNVALRVPRSASPSASSVTLLRRGELRVVLHPRRHGFLEVRGLPNVLSVGIELGGAGRGLVTGPRRARLTVALTGAAGERVAFTARPLSPRAYV